MGKLQRDHPTDWPVYMAAYFALLGEAWLTRSRKVTLEEAWCPALPCTPEDAAAVLLAARLIDSSHRVRPKAWNTWFGPAERRMENAREAALARWKGHSASNALALPEHSSGNAITTPHQTRTDEDSQPDAVSAYYRLTTRRPSANVLKWLNRLSDELGEATVEQALAIEWTADHDLSTLLSRTEARCGLAKHEAEKAAPKASPPPDDPPPIGDPEEGKRQWARLRETLPGRGLTRIRA